MDAKIAPKIGPGVHNLSIVGKYVGKCAGEGKTVVVSMLSFGIGMSRINRM